MRSEHSINFPSQAVSDLEKLNEDYGLKIARAIKHEWFSGSTSKYNSHKNNFHKFWIIFYRWIDHSWGFRLKHIYFPPNPQIYYITINP